VPDAASVTLSSANAWNICRVSGCSSVKAWPQQFVHLSEERRAQRSRAHRRPRVGRLSFMPVIPRGVAKIQRWARSTRRRWPTIASTSGSVIARSSLSHNRVTPSRFGAAGRSVPRRRRRLALATEHGRSLSRRSWTDDVATLAILGRPFLPEREVGQRAARLTAGEEQRERGKNIAGAGNGIRTRDPDLGKVVLYH
jgi:hypothetical protein